ncbi:hypothetical protein KKE26_05250, partial [bacterium]|nr:hypothetical protein [bacterium]
MATCIGPPDTIMMGCTTVLIGMAGGGGAGAAGAAAGAAAANFAVKTKRRGGLFGAIVGGIAGEILDAVMGAAIGGLPGAIVGGIVGAMKGGIPNSDKAIETTNGIDVVKKSTDKQVVSIAQAGLSKPQRLTKGNGKSVLGAGKTYTVPELGTLSAKYESNGNPGIIANNPGDPGGKSYGAWQFNTKDKVVAKFYGWTKNKNNDIYAKLNDAYIDDKNTNGTNFDAAWRKIAKENPDEFLKLQHDYTKKIYYDEAANRLVRNTGFDINKQSFALQDVLWSTAVQHGPEGCVNIFKKVDLNDSQADIITNVYNERSKHFSGCSPKVRDSVRNRLKQEKADALNILNSQ